MVVGRAPHVSGAHETFVQVEQLQRGLCGQSRPTFFRGVATVCTRRPPHPWCTALFQPLS